MSVLRGFASEGIVAVFDEAPGGGDWRDIDAPRNAPAKNPELYLDSVYFHTSLDYYTIAAQDLDIVISHAAVAGVAGVAPPPSGDVNDTPPNVTVVHEGQSVLADHLLLEHNLGYIPAFYFLQDTRIIPIGAPVQEEGTARRRFVYAYATETQIRLSEIGFSDSSTLSAIDISYGVIVFKDPTADPSMPLFGKTGSVVTLGRDKINSSQRTIRLPAAEDTPYAIPLTQAADVLNGGLRVYASDGTPLDYGVYNGSFPAPTLLSVGY